jgi:DNA-binding NtrC family response regulator
LKGLTKEAARVFKNYQWKGNVRELRNVIERASILEDGEYITLNHLPADMLSDEIMQMNAGPAFVLPESGISLDELEFELAKQAYERTGGNLTRAARLLDISRDQLRYKLRKGGFETYRE